MGEFFARIDEKKFVLLILFIAPTLTLFDVFADLKEGVSLSHIIVEIGIVTSGVLAIVMVVLLLRTKSEILKSSLVETKEELNKVSLDIKEIKEGIHNRVVKDMQEWSLTIAEQDVAFLLLKGMSTKDMALTRGSAEKTVRHQLSSIYQKSKLSNKGEFQAYFLEDIF